MTAKPQGPFEHRVIIAHCSIHLISHAPSFRDPEYPPRGALRTDTLADSVLILLALTVVQRLVGFVRAMLFCRWLTPNNWGCGTWPSASCCWPRRLSVLAIPGAFGRSWSIIGNEGNSVRSCGERCWPAAGWPCGLLGIVLGRRLVLAAGVRHAKTNPTLSCWRPVPDAVIAYNFLIELFTALRNIRLVSVLQLINSVAFAVLG